jgi:excisionase family DNA binding protein
MKAQKEEMKVNEIYSPKTVAELLEVKESFIKRQLRAGTLKGVRIGKFWRIPEENLGAYLKIVAQNGNGKGRMSGQTKNKIKFHACLKSQDSAPKTIQNLLEEIKEVKERLQEEKGPRRIPLIAKWFALTKQVSGKRRGIDSIDAQIQDLAFAAYPDAAGLADKDVDALETLFKEAAEVPEIEYRNLRRRYGAGLGLIGGIPLSILRAETADAMESRLREIVQPLLESGRYLPLAGGRVREEIPWAVYRRYRETLAGMIC